MKRQLRGSDTGRAARSWAAPGPAHGGDPRGRYEQLITRAPNKAEFAELTLAASSEPASVLAPSHCATHVCRSVLLLLSGVDRRAFRTDKVCSESAPSFQTSRGAHEQAVGVSAQRGGDR